jgi:transposase
VLAHTPYACQGRPTSRSPIKAMAWQIHAPVRPDHERIAFRKHQEACFVSGTNIDATQWRDPAVIHADKAQAQLEGGFRLLKDPLCFVSSLCVNKPCRIQGLLMVMTLALLVYSVTPRRLRQQVARQNATIPNPINQPTERPTLRWVFQLWEGIHRVRVTGQETVHDLIAGLNAVQIKILRLVGEEGCRLYQISPG